MECHQSSRKTKKYGMKIVLVYAPTSLSSQEDFNTFYDHLQTALECNNTPHNIIMGGGGGGGGVSMPKLAREWRLALEYSHQAIEMNVEKT